MKKIKQLNEALNEYLPNEYLTVKQLPCPPVKSRGFDICFYRNGEKVLNNYSGNDFSGISLIGQPDLVEWTDEQIIKVAKKSFDNVPDDIEVIRL